LGQGFGTFTETDGLESRKIVSIFETRDGKLYAVTGGRHVLNEFDGQRFNAISALLPGGIKDFGWGAWSVTLKDRRGEWWMATGQGLIRFPRVSAASNLARTAPRAIYGPAEGLPGTKVVSLFEDRRGDIWVGLWGTLARWDAATESFRDLTPALRAAIGGEPTPTRFAEDATGRIWIGLDYGGVARYREDRVERVFEPVADGIPAGAITGLLVDHRGRLWITSTGGLGRIDDPAASSPRGRPYGGAEGLASSHLFAAAEDHAGRIYVAGGQGVDRLDPATGLVQHYLAGDGLPPGETDWLYCDREGAMWFGSSLGLSRHEPGPDRPADPPAPVIHSVQVAGVPALLSDEGEPSVTGLNLPAGKDNIEIAYGSVDFVVTHGPRYQYRLLPVDAGWHRPTAVRSVQYARLGAGRYTFEVRGINSAGVVSVGAASVLFRIPPPFWQRWWFLLLSAATLFTLGYLAYAFRVRHAMAVERIRTRLASDLHDDLGSGLAEIAILAEVAKQNAHRDEGNILDAVAERARELRGTMGDIVWSVDPAGDSLTGVIRRWRQTAVSLLGGVSLAFTAPPEADTDALVMLPDRRRHLLLLFKEAITNVARHAQAAHVLVEVTCRAGQLHVRIRDDGRGFAMEDARSGHGLRSLAHRTEELKGTVNIDSSPRAGTTVEVQLPLQAG
jgi:signal transduction histidine kinase